MKYMVMYKTSDQGVWKEKKFESEKKAFSFGRGLKAWGVAAVEIYQKVRVGYRQIG